MKTLFQVTFILLLSTSFCLAQELKDASENTGSPNSVHGVKWLKKFNGNWKTVSEQENMNGSMKSAPLGSSWIVNEHTGQFFTALQTIGYDAEKKQYYGHWVDSVSDFRWNYTGSVDESGTTLTLNTDGPGMSNPKEMRRYRDIYEFVSDAEILYKSQVFNDKDEWETFMSGKMLKPVDDDAVSKPSPAMSKTVTPFLMFEGQAEEAIEFYKTVFPDTKIIDMVKYKAGEAGKEGTVQIATFTVEGQAVKCIDSPSVHDFTFTPSFSFFVECRSEEELNERFAKLSKGGKVMMPVNNYGFSKQFGWTSDKFGVSWQLNLK